MPQQLGRGAAEDQVPRRRRPPIGQHPQHREDLRAQLDLVEDDEPAQRFQCEQRVVQPVKVARALEIEPRHLAGEPGGIGHRQGGLAHLPGADQAHHRELIQQLAERRQCPYWMTFAVVS